MSKIIIIGGGIIGCALAHKLAQPIFLHKKSSLVGAF